MHVQMAGRACTFIVDTGAEISIFKLGRLSPMQPVDTNKTFSVTGVTEGVTNTLGETNTNLTFNNGLTVSHAFQLVGDDFPIITDGILGRDFFY